MTEKKPEQEDKLEQVIADLAARGIASVDSARQFFGWIEAPAHAKGLVRVCKNLLPVLRKVEPIILSNPRQFKNLIADLHLWKAIADDISGLPEGKTSLVGDYTGPHALYAALWHAPAKQELIEIHSTLMAVLCAAVAKLHVLETRGESYTSSHYNASLFARKMAKEKNEQQLRALPSEIRSLEEYLLALDKGSAEQRGLWKFLDYAVGEKAGIRRTSSWRRATAAATSVLSEDPPTLDDGDETQVVQRVQLPQQKAKLKRIRKTLASPVEFSEGRERPCITTDRAKTPREDAFVARKVSRRLAIQNQLLPTRWYMMSKYEVDTFLDGVQDISETARVGKVQGLELAAFLCVMFWLSARPESVCEFQVYSDLKAVSGNGYAAALGRPSGAFWVILPPRPKGYDHPPRRRFLAYDAERVLCLPVPEPARLIMARYLETLPNRAKGKIFRRDASTYIGAFNEFFSAFRKSRGRLTSAMLSDYLFDRIMHAPGADIVTAMLTTGRAHFLGFVPMHYTSVTVASLEKRYVDVCREIIRGSATRGRCGPPVGRGVPEGEGSKKRTGSRYCPKGETVVKLANKLQTLLAEEQLGDLTDVKNLLRIHNRMVVYTTLMIGFATGYRSVVDPFLRQAVIDRGSGFAYISDKENDSLSHSRIIWVPEMVLAQLDCYHGHLKALAKQLLVANRPRHYAIRESLREAESHPVLFFVDKSMKEVPTRKKVLEDLYEYRLDCTMPSNANRHYLRTNLLERGCPVDVIDALMGHWAHGNSAWGRFSTLSPERYKASLQAHLLPLLVQDGWRVMPGLGAEHD